MTIPTPARALYSAELPNGLQVLVCPRPGYAKGLAFFATKYGGAMRRFTLDGRAVDTPAGVAHFLEHKMFDLPEGNALAMLSQRGARANAFTSSGITAYHFDCTEGFFDGLELLCRFVSTPYFTAESVQKEQGIIGQEIRMTEDSPDFALYYAFLRALYEHNPIRDSVAGTVESIAKITPQTLYDCHGPFMRRPTWCSAPWAIWTRRPWRKRPCASCRRRKCPSRSRTSARRRRQSPPRRARSSSWTSPPRNF